MTPSNQNLHYASILLRLCPPKQNLGPSYPLYPPVTLHDLGPAASQLPSSLSLSFRLPTHHMTQKLPSAVLCVQEKRRNSESADVVPLTKRMKASSRKKKGERVGEMTKTTSFDEPTREETFVMTGGLKCSLFGLRLSNTMTKSTRLQMPTPGCLKLNSLPLASLCTVWTIASVSVCPSV